MGKGALRATAAATICGLCLAAAAPAQGPVYETFKLRFDTRDTGVRAGVILRLKQRDTPAGEQPPPIRRSDFTLPRGTEFDTRAVRRCRATNAQLQQQGLAACPKRSRLGVGEADAFLGQAGQVTLPVMAFNIRRGVLLTLTSGDTVVRTLRARIRGTHIVVDLPRLDLGDGFEAAVTRFELTIPKRGTTRRPWLSTPDTCPRSGSWRTKYVATYDEPIGTQVSRDRSRCAG